MEINSQDHGEMINMKEEFIHLETILIISMKEISEMENFKEKVK